jgi:hypothetical protein
VTASSRRPHRGTAPDWHVIGPWLPEPVDTSADPYLGAERGEALEYAAPRIARRVVVGALQVAKFLHALSWFWDGAQLDWVTTNGQAAVVVRHGDTMSGMLTISACADGIGQVLWMFNPEKITGRSLPARLAAEARFDDVTKPRSARS